MCRFYAINTTKKGAVARKENGKEEKLTLSQSKLGQALTKRADRKRSKHEKAFEMMKDTNGKRWKRGG